MKKLIFTILLILACVLFSEKVKSEDDNPELRKWEINNGSVFLFTLFPGNAAPNDTVAQLYIFSDKESEIFVDKDETILRNNLKAVKNDFVNIGLTAAEVQATDNYSEKFHEGILEGVVIKVTLPGTDAGKLYVRTKYGKNSDGMQVMDITKSGKNYFVSNPKTSDFVENIDVNFAAIVGVYENTKVTFTMGGCESCKLLKENGGLMSFGQLIKRTLNNGEVWLVPAYGDSAVLTGSTVKANKPVAVFSGSNKAYNNSETENNYTITQMLPDLSFGNSYLIPQLTGGKHSPSITVFAKQSETDIFLNKKNKQTIHNPGGVRNNGYLEIDVEDKSQSGKNTVEITSVNPIDVIMTDPNVTYMGSRITPFQMQILPTGNFSNSATFRINNIEEDFINIIYKGICLDNIPLIPEDLLISEVNNGEYHWFKLNEIFPGQGLSFDSTQSDGMCYATKNLKFLKAGTYSIKSDSAFGLYQYGFGEKTSYGFPVNGDFGKSDIPDKLPPTVTYAESCGCNFTGLAVDEPKDKPDSLISRMKLIYTDESDSYNSKLFVIPYVTGKENESIYTSKQASWTLQPIEPQKDMKAHLVFLDMNGNRTEKVIECKSSIPGILKQTSDLGQFNIHNVEDSVIFYVDIVADGNLSVNPNYAMYLVLDSDSSEAKPGDIKTYQNFEIVNLKGKNLFPLFDQNKTIKAKIRFKPDGEGKFVDSLGVKIITKDPNNVCNLKYFTRLSAIIGDNSVVADDFDFDEIETGGKMYSGINVTNQITQGESTTIDLKINNVEFVGDDIGVTGTDKVFSVNGLENISAANPAIIKPGESLTYGVMFKPKEAKEYSAKIIFKTDAFRTDSVAVLTGTGTPTSVEEIRIGNNIEISNNNGSLKFISQTNYLLDNIEIYDLSGKLVSAEKVDRDLNGYSIKTTGFITGVYIVKLNINGYWLSKKIII